MGLLQFGLVTAVPQLRLVSVVQFGSVTAIP